jgi:ATP-dependent RNA helicase SUPV3L1/SUV3
MPVSFSAPQTRDARARGVGVTAVLGPTNTGKTHLAIERMLAHSSGMIGLPLRLLAREVYNKVVDKVGADAAALITGEEKIKPANPRFWICTVEAMPRDLDVAFLAVDEIQIGADFERGHVFTDRMLNRRGREETLVLGAATVRPMVERLLPGAHILSRPRLSQLSFAGEKKLTRLQRRSAIVAFSAEEVYAVAELIRRQRGGAAVVLGALSPRTRNAQVALYQSGDVDYMVATDAIGMGLNLDVEHVAFASDRKFDGYMFRRLKPAEFAQIAGRAGRATRDGTFGTTGRCAPFEPELVQALENHSFESLKLLQWRNTALDFASLGALQASLAMAPTEQGLTRAPVAEDILVMEHAARDDDVRKMAKTRADIERLWEVCQVPDYRHIAPANHAELVTTLYGFLMREGKIPTDWFSRQVAQADRTDGDIDTLSTRIAHIRTWTFAANRPDWLADPDHWQGATRTIEDKLSDALHERLTERFVDRRTSVLMRRLRENTMLETEIAKSGDVMVEGHLIGRLGGFQFMADPASNGPEAKALRAAAQKALAGEIDTRASRLAHAADDHFVLASDGTIRWVGEPVGKIIAGDDVLAPRVRLIADEHLTGAARDSVQARLDLWLKAHIEKVLGPLLTLARAEDVTGLARGVAFQLVESLGVIERQRIAEDVKGLDQAARASLRGYGVRFGAYHVYLPALLKPGPRALAVQLWSLKRSDEETKGLDDARALATTGRTSFAADKSVNRALYRTVGYRVCGERAVRVDILERLADLIRPALAWRPGSPGEKPPGAVDGSGFAITGAMTSLTGTSGEDFASILRSLGYRMEKRPKPPEPSPAASAMPAEAPAAPADAEAATAPAGAADAASETAEPVPATETAPEATAAAEATMMPAEAPEPAQLAPAAPAESPEPTSSAEPAAPVAEEAQPTAESTDTAVQAADAESISAAPADGAPATAATADEAAEPAATETAASPAEDDLIEVWRPGRPPGERRGERRQRGPRGAEAGAPRGAERGAERSERRPRRAPAAAAEATPGASADSPAQAQAADAAAPAGDTPARHRHGRPPPRERSEREGGAPDRGRPQRAERDQRRDRDERRDRDQRRDRRRDRDQDRPDRDPELRAAFIKGQGPRKDRREREPDPNSPFAKLAALKEQLEANAKEPR